MKVILLQDVPNVGRKYEVKNVSDGFARNFLFAKKLAEIATTQSIQAIDAKKKQDEQKKEVEKDILGKNIEALEGLKISIKEKTNEKGHLFAGIRAKEIAKILKDQKNIGIPEEIIEMEKPIKEKGEHRIKVKNKEFILEIL